MNGFYAHIDKEGRIYNCRVCLLQQDATIPGRPCLGPNRVADFDGFFNIRELIGYIETQKLEPQSVAFDDLWHPSHGAGEKDWIVENDPRYKHADTGFPGILSPIVNPNDQPYRVLDGWRRMWKQQAAGRTQGRFYVLPPSDVYDYFWMVMSQDKLVGQASKLSQQSPAPSR